MRLRGFGNGSAIVGFRNRLKVEFVYVYVYLHLSIGRPTYPSFRPSIYPSSYLSIYLIIYSTCMHMSRNAYGALLLRTVHARSSTFRGLSATSMEFRV